MKLKIFEEFVILFMKDKEDWMNIKDFTIYQLWIHSHKFYSLLDNNGKQHNTNAWWSSS
jgi:hypothetical protein